MDTLNYDLKTFFANEVENLDCNTDTRAYIVSVLNGFKSTDGDLSKDSITLKYTDAKFRQDFYRFQRVADYLLFSFTFYPEHLNAASKEYYFAIGQASYYSCYLLLQRKWVLFEELSDNLPEISYKTRKIFTRG